MFIKTVLAEESTAQGLVNAVTKTGILGTYSFNDIFTWALGIGGTLALGIFMYAGVLYIASAGNSSKQEEAKEWIWAAVYGLVLLAVGYILLKHINPVILG
ncbi:MAG: hypothetical protein AAB659_00205 [Patescibacteria group bacterium]